ncbi:DUF2799 domain-containing protein [Hafnia paralvei]
MMNKYLLISCLVLSSCTQYPGRIDKGSVWFNAGFDDASSGKIVRDNDALTEWYGNPEVDRAAYLDGYNQGAHRLCQGSVIEQWGAQGKPFPASCDSAVNIAELRLKWQQGLNKTFPR